MKKILMVAIALTVLSACQKTETSSTIDTSVVKSDTTKVDTTKVDTVKTVKDSVSK